MSENIQALPASDAPHSDSLRLAKRKKLFALLGAVVGVAAIGAGTYWTLVASHHVSTDNAYVAVEMAQITPEVSGTVREVLAVDTQQVKRGDILVKLDDKDAALNLAQAEAELARAERRVQGYLASDEGLQAQVQARIADQARSNAQLVSARADLQRAELDLKRRQALAKSGSVSGEELSNGQPATLTADLYGSRITYHGKVAGLAGGSGAAFATIPAQNATGNWIKVVQRLPVRIALDPAELRAHPLQVGLSMEVTIDTASE